MELFTTNNKPPLWTYSICLKLLPMYISLFYVITPCNGLAWIEKPSVIQVLMGTTATFPWRHDGHGNIDITWYYKGTDNDRRLDTILLATKNISVAYGTKRSRLHYVHDTGSASMELEKVTFADEGNYEVSVFKHYPGTGRNDHIQSTTRLVVVNANDISYKIIINGSEYHHTDRSLGTWSHPPSDWLNISITTQPSVEPPIINMWKEVADHKIPQPECTHHYCNRYITFCDDDREFMDSKDDLRVFIEVQFRVQNVKEFIHEINAPVVTGKKHSRFDFLENKRADGIRGQGPDNITEESSGPTPPHVHPSVGGNIPPPKTGPRGRSKGHHTPGDVNCPPRQKHLSDLIVQGTGGSANMCSVKHMHQFLGIITAVLVIVT